MATDVVVIFALNREAAPFRKLAKRDRLPVRIVVAGVGAAAAEHVGDAALVISAGFCGALNPALRVGDVLTFRGDAESSERSEGAHALRSEDSSSPRNGRLVTVQHLVATPHEKQLLRERTSADVVDMEASHVAVVCRSRGIPFLAVKAVSDAADTTLSPRLLRLLAGGRVSPLQAAATVLVQPRILTEFRRLARDTRLAANRLAEKLIEVCRRQMSPV